MFEGRRGLPFLGKLQGDLSYRRLAVIGPKLDNLYELGPRLVALVGRLIVVGQGLMDLDQIGRFLELVRARSLWRSWNRSIFNNLARRL